MQTAQAGTLESNDILVTVAAGSPGSGLVIDLEYRDGTVIDTVRQAGS